MIYFLSYPKSGRTWVRFMLAKYYTSVYNVKFKKHDFLEFDYLHKLNRKIPAINFTHNKAYTTDNWKIEEFHKQKIIFLIRDPRDVMVSFYFQQTKRKSIPYKNMSNFIRNSPYLRRYIGWHNMWCKNCTRIPKAHLWITYENLHSNCKLTLSKILRFTDAIIDVKCIKQVIEESKFDNMRKIEKTGKYGRLRTKSKGTEAFKVRKGKVRNYKEYLSKSDIIYINNMLASYLKNNIIRSLYVS